MRRASSHTLQCKGIFDIIPKYLLDDNIVFDIHDSGSINQFFNIDNICILEYDGSPHFFSTLRITMDDIPEDCKLDWKDVSDPVPNGYTGSAQNFYNNCIYLQFHPIHELNANPKTLQLRAGSTLIIARESDREAKLHHMRLLVVPCTNIRDVMQRITECTVPYYRYIEKPIHDGADPAVVEMVQRLTDITKSIGEYVNSHGGNINAKDQSKQDNVSDTP
ncbi:MAG: hypothetical protein NC114_09865 [Ruminococcus flavefaciens]|nr:hypothetical protein [Ruminococcus flavefaciens]